MQAKYYNNYKNMKNEEIKKESGDKQPVAPVPANIAEIIKRGNDIYEKFRTILEKAHNGKYVVIEVESEKYFVGETRDEATLNAKKEFPDVVMFIRRIGQVEKASRHISRYHPSYARLF